VKTQSALRAARGLGSALTGTHHWWWQRLTAIALVPLSVWFVLAVIQKTRGDYDAIVEWMRSPGVTVLLLAFILISFYHLQLGAQEVIEDWLHAPWQKLSAQILLRFACFLFGLAAAVAVLKVSLGA
jgi:succinate dehydrogenase / fumarate reductase membrane anchor subunit